MSMNVRRVNRRDNEDEVWKEFETFIAVDEWWLDE